MAHSEYTLKTSLASATSSALTLVPSGTSAITTIVPRSNSHLKSRDLTWEQCIQNLPNSLRENKIKIKINEYSTLKDLQDHVERLQAKHSNTLVPKFLSKLGPFFDGISRFVRIVNIFVQANGEMFAPIWGTLVFTIDMMVQYQKYLENVTGLLVHLNNHLPRLTAYSELFKNAPSLETAVKELYLEVIQSFIGISKFLNRGSFHNLLRFGIPWKNLTEKLGISVETVRRHGEWIDKEALLLFMRKTGEEKEDLQEEIRRLREDLSPRMTEKKIQQLRFSVPYPRSLEFFGRQDCLSKLSNHFGIHETEPVGLKIFSLLGMAGIGKTQIALEFCHKHRNDYDSVFWVNANTKTKLTETFSKIHRHLCLSGDGEDIMQACEAVKVWFETEDKKWLLVFDHVENLNDLRPFLPTGAYSQYSSIIITSRVMSLHQGPITSDLKVPLFSQEESQKFFLRVLGDGYEKEEGRNEIALEIGDVLGGLPLALRQFAGYVSGAGWSLKEFKKEIDAQKDTLIDLKHTVWAQLINDNYHYSGTFRAAMDVSLEGLRPSTFKLLKLLAFFDPDTISEGLFKDITDDSKITDIFANFSQIQAAITELNSRSFIDRNKGIEHGTVNIHRLTQSIVFTKMSEEEQVELFTIAVDILWEIFPFGFDGENKFESWSLCELCLPHAQKLDTFFWDRKYHRTISIDGFGSLGYVLLRAAYYLKSRRLLNESRKLFESVRRIATDYKTLLDTEVDSESDIRMFKTLLADYHLNMGDLEMLERNLTSGSAKLGCLEHFKESLRLRESGECNPNLHLMITTRMNLGNVYTAIGEADTGLKYLQQALDERKAEIRDLESPQNPDEIPQDIAPYDEFLALHHGNLCCALMAKGNFKEALIHSEFETGLNLSQFGPDHEIIGNCFFTRARVDIGLGRWKDAETHLLRSVRLCRKTLGEHPRTAYSIHKLAWLLHRQTRYAESLDFFKEAVRIFRKYPSERPALGRTRFEESKLLKEYLTTFSSCQDAEGTLVKEMTQEMSFAREEALKIYIENRGSDTANPGSEDFDKLVLFWDR